MAFINCGGVEIDTEDIDLLVRYVPLSTLDGLVRAETEMLREMRPDDPLRSWQEHRVESHRIALEIKERTISEGAEIVRPILMPKSIIEKEIIRDAHKPKKKRKFEGI